LPAVLHGGADPAVSPVEWQGSGDLANTAAANCFLMVPPERDSLAEGEVVRVLLG
jgi:molybdopterin molybdotransferase